MVRIIFDCRSSLSRLNLRDTDAHGHGIGGHAAHGPEAADAFTSPEEKKGDVELAVVRTNVFDHNLMTQIIGVAILEFGVVLHRYLHRLVL